MARRLQPLVGAVLDDLPAEPGAEQHGAHLLVRAAADGYAAAGARAARHLTPDQPVDVVLTAATRSQARAFAQSLVTASQQPRPGEHRMVRVWCPSPRQVDPAVAGATVGSAVLRARRLANLPGNVKNPDLLALAATQLASRRPDTRVASHGEPWLHKHGFNGVLAVGAGSAQASNVTVIEYGRTHAGPHVVLVGKGVTFDSGGLSLKPGPAMTLMKTDMSGAAAVIGTIAAVQDMELPIRVTGILGCAENMPDGAAMRPGDVVRHVGGRTSEVRNTDAEGRLVLADCLAYAAARLAPDYLVDLATLTGAATVGLGRQHAALFTADDELARGLVKASGGSGDRVWRMPLVEEYREAIDSDVADAANSTSTPGAGAITAALFLQPFAGTSRWAHLDIAGPARTESDRPDCRKGATGYGVSLLTHWLARLAGRPL